MHRAPDRFCNIGFTGRQSRCGKSLENWPCEGRVIIVKQLLQRQDGVVRETGCRGITWLYQLHADVEMSQFMREGTGKTSIACLLAV